MLTFSGFLKSLLLFSALIYLAGFIIFSTVLSDHYLPVFHLLVFYFTLLSIAGRLVIGKTNMQKPGEFNMRYFLVRWTKVLLHIAFIVVYLFINRENILAFVLTFMCGYILYSIFDVYSLNFYLKKK